MQYFQYAKGQEAEKRTAAKKMDYTVQLSVAKQNRIEAEKAAKAAAKAAKKSKRNMPKPSAQAATPRKNAELEE